MHNKHHILLQRRIAPWVIAAMTAMAACQAPLARAEEAPTAASSQEQAHQAAFEQA